MKYQGEEMKKIFYPFGTQTQCVYSDLAIPFHIMARRANADKNKIIDYIR